MSEEPYSFDELPPHCNPPPPPIRDYKTQPRPKLAALQDRDPMPFGKHKGKAMESVPVHYLHWWWHNTERNNPAVRDYIFRNINALADENDKLVWEA